MSNSWYTPGSVPVTQSRGSSATIRAEYAAIEAAFDKLPTPTQTWGQNANFAIAGGSVDAWTVSIAATYLTSYVDGMQIRVKFPDANTLASPTVNLNALGAKEIVSEAGASVTAGDIAAGSIHTLVYNATSGKFQIWLGNAVSSAAASAATATAAAGTATSQAAIATAKAGEASDSATLAQDWATKTDGEVVSGEGYGAKKYAQDASASATAAGTSATEAADSAAAALGYAGIFTTTAQGLTSSSEGQRFLVRTADLYTFDAYYDNGGVATSLGTVYLTSGERYTQNSGTAVHGAFTDENGNTLAYWTDEGLYYWNETEGEYVLLTGAPDEVESTSATELAVGWESSDGVSLGGVATDGRLKLHGLGDAFDQVSSADLIVGLRYASNGDTAQSQFYYDKAQHALKQRVRTDTIACHHNESAGTSFARMPSLLKLTETATQWTGLIFFTQRNSFYNNGENAQRACCKSVTVDLTTGQVSFGSLVVIYQRAEWGNATPGGWVANPVSFVEGASGANPGRIHCLMNTFDSPTGIMDNGDYYIADFYSDDSGATWSAPTKIMGKEQVFNTLTGGTGGVTGSLTADPTTKRYGPITSTGNSLIRITQGAHAGRIVVSINVLNDGTGAYSARWWQGAMYSDDEGATWTRGTLYFAAANQNEAQIVERSDGSLLRLVRDDVNDGVTNQLRRGQAESSDGGATWTYIGLNTTATFNNCSGSLMRVAFDADSAYGRIVAGGPTTATYGRRNTARLLLSYDDGDTFIAGYAPFEDVYGVGYQFLLRTDSGLTLLAYETFNGLGAINTADSVWLLAVNDAEIFANASLV